LIPNGEAMLAKQFLAAAAGARNSTALDETARLLWRARAEGNLADADTEAVSMALQARRGFFLWVKEPKPSQKLSWAFLEARSAHLGSRQDWRRDVR
jgi:hypothetical protein